MVDVLRSFEPLTLARPRGAHRYDVFSPKLGRRLTLYRRRAFEAWLMLGADPAAKTFCERPGFMAVDGQRCVVDFRARSDDRMSLQVSRPVDPSLHPLVTGNYRIATPAIESFYELVVSCLRYRVTGALIYGAPRIGKTRSIEYVRLLLAREYPRVTSYHARCEHKPRHAEGPFFSNLLEAVGDHDPNANAGTNPAKRMRLSLRIREAAARAGSGTVLLFCDEAQRYNENEYEWLRDVHDALDRQQIKLFTFPVGQQELLAQKSALQIAGKTQIVARLMVEELAFHGIRNAEDVATCLNGYDQTPIPRTRNGASRGFTCHRRSRQGIDLSTMRPCSGVPSRPRTTRRPCLAVSKYLWNRLRGPSRSCSRIANSGCSGVLSRRLVMGPRCAALRLCPVPPCNRARACPRVTRRPR